MKYLEYLFLTGLIVSVLACSASTESLDSTDESGLGKEKSETENVAAPVPTTSTQVSQVSAGIIEASEIISEFDDNAVSASTKYMDKDISVTGVISDIGIDTWTEKTYVSVGTDELFDMYEIRCILDKPSEVTGLGKGSSITVSGTFHEYDGFMYIDIKPCSIGG